MVDAVMKRAMTGGAHRGPVGPARQRRAIRVVQAILVVLAVVLLFAAGYGRGRAAAAGDEGRTLAPPRHASVAQTAVLTVLGVGAVVGALLLQGPGVRVPTPGRLEELTGRAEEGWRRRADALIPPPAGAERTPGGGEHGPG